MVTADVGLQRPPARRLAGHITLGIVAVLVFVVFHATTGLLEVGNGEGWDGANYTRMLRDGWSGGSIHTQLRPLIVWANTPAYALTGHAVQAFDVMNFVYAALLAVVLSLLLERYGADAGTRAVAVVCIALTNGFRLFSFYPVMIDLGACAVMAWALWLILAGPRWAAAVACVAAVMAREYAPILLFFGVHRDLRTGTPLRSIVATYLPAAIVWTVVRVTVVRAWAPVEDGTTMEVLLDNRRLWADPMFAGLFFYFLVTFAGGVSMLAVARPARFWSLIRQEPEWVSYAAPLVAVTALGGADLWRYLIPLLPVAAVFYAHSLRDTTRRGRLVLGTCAIALTYWTQQPFKRMDVASYFADWFPYYILMGQYPSSPTPSLWPDWGWRFLVVAVSLCVLIACINGRERTVPVTT